MILVFILFAIQDLPPFGPGKNGLDPVRVKKASFSDKQIDDDIERLLESIANQEESGLPLAITKNGIIPTYPPKTDGRKSAPPMAVAVDDTADEGHVGTGSGSGAYGGHGGAGVDEIDAFKNLFPPGAVPDEKTIKAIEKELGKLLGEEVSLKDLFSDPEVMKKFIEKLKEKFPDKAKKSDLGLGDPDELARMNKFAENMKKAMGEGGLLSKITCPELAGVKAKLAMIASLMMASMNNANPVFRIGLHAIVKALCELILADVTGIIGKNIAKGDFKSGELESQATTCGDRAKSLMALSDGELKNWEEIRRGYIALNKDMSSLAKTT